MVSLPRLYPLGSAVCSLRCFGRVAEHGRGTQQSSWRGRARRREPVNVPSQPSPPGGQQTRGGSPDAGPAPRSADSRLADDLESEQKLPSLALPLSKTENQQVRHFAEMLEKDHSQVPHQAAAFCRSHGRSDQCRNSRGR